MGSISLSEKPHAVCVPYPAQGHINPMLKLAKILHSKGFHITFVNTQYNHNRLIRSRGPDAVAGLPDFRFEAIPDGLPQPDGDATQDIPSLCVSTSKTCLVPFRNLLAKLNGGAGAGVPPVSCIVADGAMSFTLDAAEELGVPNVLFWTPSAIGVLGYTQYKHLVARGLVPLKDESFLTNGYLNTTIDWIPAIKSIRLIDLPSFIRTVDPNEIMVNFVIGETDRGHRASALILNTFDALEPDALAGLSSIYSTPLYGVGPLQLVADQSPTIASNLWKEESECIDWLDSQQPNSVVYVNFGSIAIMTRGQLIEFAWGLANSGKSFLWIIRPDLVAGESRILPPEFVEETKDRGKLASWCPQEQVLKHPAIGGFLTHCGWNSTLEAVCGGVPIICWPFFAEQPTNSWYSCNEWGIGMEIDTNVKRDEVEKQVRELMVGEKGKDTARKAMEWKKAAEEAVAPGGSSHLNLEKLVKVLLQK